ncbi:unnamed protein product [Aphanomyces euteiches]|uniref:DUSP domain-containing protein n=1 Tax=Aphanomyces euteiches TaxID=100861 RepID=A0A6G0W8Q1_9STRA|nr:hypothetical protein Ae201684_018369 [Aphanomyces euteiches]KAH9097600.1 hypothetical protein Ae201684P_001076 [Aphanomyces euteiches]KAH9140001.1 hypothetical protein AeRB84_015726 [Aphanomyces euteiches]
MQVTWLCVGRFLTSTELGRLSMCSKELHGHVASVALILCKEAAALQFISADAKPPVSNLMWLHCIELQMIKAYLLHATALLDVSNNSSYVVISKAFVLTCRKQCVKADKLLAQGPKLFKSNLAKPKKIDSMDLLSQREIEDLSESITCAHNRLRPLAVSKSHGKRMALPLFAWKKLYAYFPAPVFGCGLPAGECHKCLADAHEEEEARNNKKTQRFVEHTTSDALVDLVMRKGLHPPALFSTDINTFYLVPFKWMKHWRAYVKSASDDPPGPILNGHLLCVRHKRPVVPTGVGLFLAGASNSLCQPIPGIKTTAYEIVTAAEWEDLTDIYCAEVGVGFAVVQGTVHWQSQPCHLCAEHVDLSTKRSNPNKRR